MRQSGYDLRAIKRLDNFRNTDVQVRTVLLGIVALILNWITSDVIYLWWYAAVQLAFAVYLWILHRTPNRVSGRRYLYIAIIGHVSFALLVSICVYLFADPNGAMQHAALVLYFCIAMNTLVLRIRAPYLYLIDVGALFVAAICFIGVAAWRSGLSAELLVTTVGLFLFCLYFAHLVFEANRARRKREAQTLRQVTFEHQRSIGQISAGVAHDFNNLLTVVLGNLELSREVDKPEDREALLKEAETAARRGAKLTGQLLAFSRRANLSPAPIQVEDLKAELEPLAAGMLGKRHRLQVGQVSGLPPLFADSATLLAVLLNLILNAREAMPNGGTIWLDADLDTEADPPLMCLRVNDTGTGIDRDLRDKVFEPFFSTKAPGQGSGLGLPMALGFAEQSGGEIELNSMPGEGTEVVLRLPLATAAQQKAHEDAKLDVAAQ